MVHWQNNCRKLKENYAILLTLKNRETSILDYYTRFEGLIEHG